MMPITWTIRRSTGPTVRGLVATAFVAQLILPPAACLAAGERRTYFYLPDHLGSTNLVADEQGRVVQRFEYRPYGGATIQPATDARPHQFTGQRRDATGFYFYHARYYDAALGRFVSPDSVVQAPADPQSLNRYAYVRNNPTNRTDPTGHFSFFKWIKSLFSPEAVAERLVPTTIAVGAVQDYQQTTSALAERLGGSASYASAALAALPHLAMGNLPAAAIVFGATVGAHELLTTGEGRQLVSRIAKELFDDAVGMSPRAAYVASAIVLDTATALVLESVIAIGLNGPPQTAHPTTPGEIPKHPSGVWPYGPYPGDGQNNNLQMQTIGNKTVVGQGTITQGIFQMLPMKALHVGASTNGNGVMQALPGGWLVYGTYGVCHTASNLTMLQVGQSNTTLLNTPDWSTAASTVLYGNYGGGLLRSIGTGIDARRAIDE